MGPGGVVFKNIKPASIRSSSESTIPASFGLVIPFSAKRSAATRVCSSHPIQLGFSGQERGGGAALFTFLPTCHRLGGSRGLLASAKGVGGKLARWVMLALLLLPQGLKTLPASTQEPKPSGWKAEVLSRMDQRAAHFTGLSKKLWEIAEISFEEFQSAELIAFELRGAGFQIQTNIGGMPTSFIASWGTGKPVIGILGEYDALPGLRQEAIPEKRPTGMLGAGHGCGHNLLGTAAAFAAMTCKEFMQANSLGGTIRFYGCPAEENGSGKVHMTRANAFKDCDVALTWHPDDRNEPGMRTTLANVGASFRFRGTAAHAARAPEKGRSALDAVMLMAHAVDMLREHVPSDTRIHYYVASGGASANIVPEFSDIRLTVRHPDAPTLAAIWKRAVKCAEAGALATETQLEVEILGALSNVLPNDTLARLSETNMRLVGGVRYTPEERQFAEKIRALLPQDGLPDLDSASQVLAIQEGVTFWSTDVGDVSWQIPTGEIRASTFVPGVLPHTWQSTACAGMSIGQKGMLVAAKTIALTAIDLFQKPAFVEEARKTFEKRRANHIYSSQLPPEAKPQVRPRPK